MRAIHLTITHSAEIAAAVVILRIMIYVLTPEQMRAVDAAAVEQAGANKLMRNAGRRIAKRLRAMAKPGARIVAFAGPGQ